jgi:hypothetical protein
MTAAERRAMALDCAAAAILQHVPDIAGLITNLEMGGGSHRLATALRARWRPPPTPPSEHGSDHRRNPAHPEQMANATAVALMGGRVRPDAGVWAAAAQRAIGGGGR